MNPLRLRARKYRSFDELDLELPAGCVGVTGDNGAGKSTIVNAIDVALFGPETRSLEPYLTENAVPGDTLSLELQLEHHGDTYRIRRSYTSGAGGRGKSTCDFERDAAKPEAAASRWEPLTQATIADTQMLIDHTLGLNRETFRASAMLAQGEGGSFAEAAPRDRKRILFDALNLGFWDHCKELAAADRRSRSETIDALSGRIGLLDERLTDSGALATRAAELDEHVRESEVRLSELDNRAAAAKVEHEGVAERIQNARAAATALQAARAEVTALAREQDRAEQAAAAIAELEPKLPTLQAAAAEFTEIERKRDLIREKQAKLQMIHSGRRAEQRDLERLQGQRSGLLARIEAIEHEAAPICDRCEQPLPDTARATALEKLRAETAAIVEQITAHERSLDELAQAEHEVREELAGAGDEQEILTRGRQLQHSRTDYAAAVERLAGLRATATLRDGFAGELLEAKRKVKQHRAELTWADEPEPGLLEQKQATVGDLIRAVQVARLEHDRLREEQVRAQTQLEATHQAINERAQAQVERDRLRAELDELQLLERAFGRDGVPTWILETSAIPALEIEADRLLGTLGTDCRVELRTERELKSGGAAETLDIILITPKGERDYSTFSGGERTRLNLALRLALAQLLAHRRGAESRALIIDEPDFLDAAGTEKLVDALREMADSGVFATILLVSHVPALRDAFDTTLNVVKTNGRSEVLAA